MRNFITARLYRQWNRTVFYSATSHRAELRYANYRRLMSLFLVSLIIDGVTSFLRILNVRNTCKRM